jgi:hypothetical protein
MIKANFGTLTLENPEEVNILQNNFINNSKIYFECHVTKCEGILSSIFYQPNYDYIGHDKILVSMEDTFSDPVIFFFFFNNFIGYRNLYIFAL